jgi:hypothetical protein
MLKGYTFKTTIDPVTGLPVTTTYGVPESDYIDLPLGDGATVDPNPLAVTEANCEVCHVSVQFHGDRRQDVNACVVCHTAGAEDRYSATDPTTTPGVTIDLPVVLHKAAAAPRLLRPR